MYYAKRYGLTRDDLCYILDPQSLYGPVFPGDAFRVLKEKEEKQYGEYRTCRFVLEVSDNMESMHIKRSTLQFAFAPAGYCEESRASRDDEAISKRDCHALWARNDTFLVVPNVNYFMHSVITSTDSTGLAKEEE